MLPNSMIYFLTRERQRRYEQEAEYSRQVKEALKDRPVTQRRSLRAWLGRRLVTWGDRLQAGASSIPDLSR